MVKRSRSRSRTLIAKPRSLVELAKLFEALSKEVLAARSALTSKEQQLSEIREALANATGATLMQNARDIRRTRSQVRPTLPAKGGKRTRNGTLRDFVTRAMADGLERSPTDVHAAVLKLGYRSKSNPSTQRVMISQTLARLTKAKALKNPGRARYV